ncbi:MAG: transposase [Nitrososphaerota archaeon]|nr:transposase [Nitrososphaerota archaeon]
MRECFERDCCRFGCEIFALHVGDDHVHIFVGLHFDCSV